MLKLILITPLAITLPMSIAHAQNSTTNCYRVETTVQCQTQTQQPYVAPVQPQMSMRDLMGLSGNANDEIQSSAQQSLRNQALQQHLEQQRQQIAQQQQSLAAERAKNDYDENMAAIQRERASFQAQVRRDVSLSLSVGNCKEAIEESLKYGEIEMATQAKAFCAKP